MKIGFCGTMSVGKTTLVNALKELPEFKDYYFATERSKYLRDLGIPLNTDSTLKGQTMFLAERVSEVMRENVITDRTIIDIIAFTECAKSIHWLEKKEYITFALNFLRDYDYIFYISPEGIEIEDNGVRETDVEYRKKIDESIKNILLINKHKIKNFHRLSGTTEERIQTIKEVLSL